jgi:hypothetical protein
VSRITVFRADPAGSLPNMILWVDDVPESEEEDPVDVDPPPTNVKWRVMKRDTGENGRNVNVLREHFLGAKD